MSDAPERIWADQDNLTLVEVDPEEVMKSDEVEYIRADLVPKWYADLEADRDRMRKALKQLDVPCNCHPAFSERGLQDPACGAGDYGDIAREGLGLPPACQFNTRFTAPPKGETK